MGSCSNHRAYLYDRGGERRISELWPLTNVRWERVRDDMSSGRIFMQAPDPRCHQYLAEAEPGRHELVLFRNGKRVWEGPITRTEELGPRIEVEGRDVTHYLNRTIMRQAYSNAYPKIGYATERLALILRTELARKEVLDPPINVLPYVDVRTTDTSAKTSRATLKYEKYVYEELDSMAAKTGIDYTVLGRSLIINDVHEPLGYGDLLTEADFDGDVAVTAYGMETATVSAVTDGQGRYGKFGGVDTYYGEIELLHTSFDEGTGANIAEQLTEAEMVTQARRNMSGRYPTPRVVRVPANTTLRRGTVEAQIDNLIPGFLFPVRTTRTYRQMEQMQKLDRVVFEEDQNGESVKVTLSPAVGTTPWDDSGETGSGGQE